MNNFKIITYQKEDISLQIKMTNDRVIWLNKDQISKLYNRSKRTIERAINELQLRQNENVCATQTRHFDDDKKIYYNSHHLLFLDGVFDTKNGTELIKYIVNNQTINYSENDSAIIIYNNGEQNIDVSFSLNDQMVWLSAKQIADLYGIDTRTVYFHIKNIFDEGELNTPTTQYYWLVQNDENEKKIEFEKTIISLVKEGDRTVNRNITVYGFDLILAIGYRTKSAKAIAFRWWVTRIIEQYVFKGFAINKDVFQIGNDKYAELIRILNEIKASSKRIEQNKPEEKFFASGEYFDARFAVNNIIRSATKSLIIEDPYFDDIGLSFLKKSKVKNVKVILCGKKQLDPLDLLAFEKQYFKVDVFVSNDFHDRYIIVDKNAFYKLGGSLNNLADKAFSISKVTDKTENEKVLKEIEAVNRRFDDPIV